MSRRRDELNKTRESLLEKSGIRHNPCQGCDAYYTREGEYGRCAVEMDEGCQWILLFLEAIDSGKTTW